MSNVELLDEIKQFLYSVGLPEDHVPSTKELSLHGRLDIVSNSFWSMLIEAVYVCLSLVVNYMINLEI